MRHLSPFSITLLCSLAAALCLSLGGWLRTPHTPPAEEAAMTFETALEQVGCRLGDKVFLRIFKEETQLELWMAPKGSAVYRLVRIYPICAMSGTLGPKLKEGDKQAPEGFYAFGAQALNPNSRFHLSFNIGYPNAYDRAHGRTGSFIMVHGNCVSSGCFAMTDPVIEQLYEAVQQALGAGQPFIRVHVFPFRMTRQAMHRHQESPWFAFWSMLQTGYDFFENSHIPPVVDVKEGAYVITGSAAE